MCNNCKYINQEDPWCDSNADTWHISPNGCDIDEMVFDYNNRFRKITEIWIHSLETITDFVCGKANILQAPGVPKYCKNLHQYRMRNKTIDEACAILGNISLNKCKDFDSILSTVTDAVIKAHKDNLLKGFGILATFDFSQRYAINKGIYPEVVYLHAGVSIGVNALNDACWVIPIYKDKHNHKYIKLESLPKPIADLGAFHAENFLCIYKKLLQKISKKQSK